jgi:hypothetical protein
MTHESHHRVTVKKVYRMRNTREGNPRFRLITGTGELITARDSQVGLSVDETWEDVELDITLRDGELVELKRVEVSED